MSLKWNRALAIDLAAGSNAGEAAKSVPYSTYQHFSIIFVSDKRGRKPPQKNGVIGVRFITHAFFVFSCKVRYRYGTTYSYLYVPRYCTYYEEDSILRGQYGIRYYFKEYVVCLTLIEKK